MNPTPLDSDVTRAAVTAAAQAIQADAERQGHQLSYEQCEELAIVVIGHYQAFTAGVNYASGLPPAGQPVRATDPDQNTAASKPATVDDQSSTEPGQ